MDAPAGIAAASAPAKSVSTVRKEASNRNERRREFEQELIRRIRRLTGCKISQLTVEFKPGSIRLTGSCWTFYTKQLAQHAVMALAEGETIENEIEVHAP